MTSSISSSLKSNCSESNAPKKDIYLHKVSALERHNLSTVLDELNIWADLAVNHMGYTNMDLQEIRRAVQMGNSPSDLLLTMWTQQNHTTTELFILLYRMKQYKAMNVMRNLVDPKYHRLIVNEQSNFSNNGNFEKSLNGAPPRTSNEETTTTGYNSTDRVPNFKNINDYASKIPQIDYKELLEATNNWDEKNILGKGGFGTVFRGIWKYTAVAIKKLEYRGDESPAVRKIQMQQNLNELKYLNSCRHDNILPLYGFSIDGENPCLIYKLMTGGSLEQRLSTGQRQFLGWNQRLNIAKGTARGLTYLHTFKEKPLIHGDIKPANILLDLYGNPTIGDFGLAREGPNSLNSSMEVSRVYGTKPYLPIEFLGYRSLSTKVDIYSFGVVLLELLTGLRAYDKFREHKFLTKHVLVKCSEKVPTLMIMDKALPIDHEAINICEKFIYLGGICVAQTPEQRPDMGIVFWHLESQ